MTLKVRFPSGEVREVPAGTPVFELVSDPAFPRTTLALVAARANNEVVNLQHPLLVNTALSPVDAGSPEGVVIYRKSLCFLLFLAARRVLPGKRLVIGHSLGQGYFYYFDGLEEVPGGVLERVEAEMRGIVAKDRPIRSMRMSYMDGVRYFESHDQPDTVQLLKNGNEPEITVNSCDGFLDLAHGPLVPSTGVLSVFGVKAYPPGFLLRYPPSESPGALGPFVENPVLFSI